jgi:16S rRNA processing protein RimM
MSLLEVGKIAKSHGLKGEVIVELYTNRAERVARGAELTTSTRVLTVERSQPHQHRWIVKFEGINSREEADELHGTVLSAEPIEDPDALWVHELLGAEVRDVNGEKIDTVAAIVANPAGDLIETEGGHLVPLRFVVEHGDGFVRIDPPEGLFDLL